jgi:hypothetical protein
MPFTDDEIDIGGSALKSKMSLGQYAGGIPSSGIMGKSGSVANLRIK